MTHAAIAAGMLTFSVLCIARGFAGCARERDAWRNAYHSVRLLFCDLNPWTLLLDRTVWVRKYNGSKWEEAEVVAVSHKGAMAVRRIGEEHTFWICKDRVADRVRLEKPEEEC